MIGPYTEDMLVSASISKKLTIRSDHNGSVNIEHQITSMLYNDSIVGDGN